MKLLLAVLLMTAPISAQLKVSDVASVERTGMMTHLITHDNEVYSATVVDFDVANGEVLFPAGFTKATFEEPKVVWRKTWVTRTPGGGTEEVTITMEPTESELRSDTKLKEAWDRFNWMVRMAQRTSPPIGHHG